MNFRIGTWNISEGIQAIWNLRDGLKEGETYKETDLILEITQKINQLDLDILCFQEFPVEIDGRELLKEKIYHETDLKNSVMLGTAPSFLFKGGNVGVSIFSKYPIIYEEKLLFNNPNFSRISKDGKKYVSFDKGIVLAKIQLPHDEVTIITGHAIAFRPFDKTSDDFPESYKPLEELICNNNINNKLIVCGDFNSTHLYDLIPNIHGKVNDIVEGITIIDERKEDEIIGIKSDYIMITPNISANKVEKILNLSDHYLCVADLEVWGVYRRMKKSQLEKQLDVIW